MQPSADSTKPGYQATVSRRLQATLEGQHALEVEGVSKVFATRPGLVARLRRAPGGGKRIVAVDDVSLVVERGEIFGILGPNGTGKSTLIRLMSTLLSPDAGHVRVFGYDVVHQEAEVKKLINRVSVEASFFKKLSPMENLLFGARLYGRDADSSRRDIVAILTRLGLDGRSITSPMEDMSRGMQQKVAIARAFLTAPVLLLLDEPTTGSTRIQSARCRRSCAKSATSTTPPCSSPPTICRRPMRFATVSPSSIAAASWHSIHRPS